ncbi:MAG: lysophospholipid acyltransferase family protein [bacterium]|nr:lysophospholipid acyltransferase family protein [bacterium]
MVVQESLFRDIVRIFVWYPFRWLVVMLPVTWGIRLFRGFGWMHAMFSKGRRQHLLDQYHLLIKASSRNGENKFIQEYLANHYIAQLSIFLFSRLNQNNIRSIHSFSGLEHLEQARQHNRGAILLHAHFGPAQLTLVALALQRYQMIQIGLPTNENLSWLGRKVSFRLRIHYESKIPAKIVPANGYLRTVIEGLHDNSVVMLTGDGAGGGKFIGKFIPLPFLGNPFPFSVGAMLMAQKTGAPILPTFIIPISETKWQTVIKPPLNPNQTIEKQLAEFVAILESYVVKYPASWHFWPEIADRIAYAKKLNTEP